MRNYKLQHIERTNFILLVVLGLDLYKFRRNLIFRYESVKAYECVCNKEKEKGKKNIDYYEQDYMLWK